AHRSATSPSSSSPGSSPSGSRQKTIEGIRSSESMRTTWTSPPASVAAEVAVVPKSIASVHAPLGMGAVLEHVHEHLRRPEPAAAVHVPGPLDCRDPVVESRVVGCDPVDDAVADAIELGTLLGQDRFDARPR